MDAERGGERRGLRLKGPKAWWNTRVKWILVLGLFVLLAIFSVSAAIVVTLFLVALLLNLDRSIPLTVSLALLLICVLMTALQQQTAAKVLAEWAYYFLAIGVVLIFIDHVRTGPESDS
jgi:hypothetical protein